MSTILAIPPMSETVGSAAKRTQATLRDCTPNCPPDCPDCGQQVSFKKQSKGDVYESYAQTRKKKRNIALLTGTGVLALGAAACGPTSQPSQPATGGIIKEKVTI